jgi:hypothetical protein
MPYGSVNPVALRAPTNRIGTAVYASGVAGKNKPVKSKHPGVEVADAIAALPATEHDRVGDPLEVAPVHLHKVSTAFWALWHIVCRINIMLPRHLGGKQWRTTPVLGGCRHLCFA